MEVDSGFIQLSIFHFPLRMKNTKSIKRSSIFHFPFSNGKWKTKVHFPFEMENGKWKMYVHFPFFIFHVTVCTRTFIIHLISFLLFRHFVLMESACLRDSGVLVFENIELYIKCNRACK